MWYVIKSRSSMQVIYASSDLPRNLSTCTNTPIGIMPMLKELNLDKVTLTFLANNVKDNLEFLRTS